MTKKRLLAELFVTADVRRNCESLQEFIVKHLQGKARTYSVPVPGSKKKETYLVPALPCLLCTKGLVEIVVTVNQSGWSFCGNLDMDDLYVTPLGNIKIDHKKMKVLKTANLDNTKMDASVVAAIVCNFIFAHAVLPFDMESLVDRLRDFNGNCKALLNYPGLKQEIGKLSQFEILHMRGLQIQRLDKAKHSRIMEKLPYCEVNEYHWKLRMEGNSYFEKILKRKRTVFKMEELNAADAENLPQEQVEGSSPKRLKRAASPGNKKRKGDSEVLQALSSAPPAKSQDNQALPAAPPSKCPRRATTAEKNEMKRQAQASAAQDSSCQVLQALSSVPPAKAQDNQALPAAPPSKRRRRATTAEKKEMKRQAQASAAQDTSCQVSQDYDIDLDLAKKITRATKADASLDDYLSPKLAAKVTEIMEGQANPPPVFGKDADDDRTAFFKMLLDVVSLEYADDGSSLSRNARNSQLHGFMDHSVQPARTGCKKTRKRNATLPEPAIMRFSYAQVEHMIGCALPGFFCQFYLAMADEDEIDYPNEETMSELCMGYRSPGNA